MTGLMPTIFFGHGNPLHAISKNVYSDGFASVGKSLPRPRAILSISAHWCISTSAVTASLSPPTIHDFRGFPNELYQVQYNAPGDPHLAEHIRDMLSPVDVTLDENRGLDHGTWAVLMHAFPDADIPVIQLSINATKPPEFHYEIGKRLSLLRKEGVLIIGSGNIVHNLYEYAWGNPGIEPYDWALRFENKIRESILNRDDKQIVEYDKLGQDAMMAVPTPDHYLPLLYVIASRDENDEISFPVQGFDGGSVSMLAVQIG